jgi:cytochrome oxidase Cu insertion factor (SCO1/SenC/PrrC family)
MHKPTMRTVSRWMVVSLVVIVGASIMLHNALAGPSNAAPHLTAGTQLDGRQAPDFALRDQTGTTIRLSQLHGRVVMLSFLDAACTSACTVDAECLEQTAHDLTGNSAPVTWLAVSTNPSNTAASAQAYIESHHITVPLHILLGSPAELRSVWQAYAISVAPAQGSNSAASATAVSYVLDPSGREQELLHQDYDPHAAAQDIRALSGR